jgi:hypothetical protein
MTDRPDAPKFSNLAEALETGKRQVEGAFSKRSNLPGENAPAETDAPFSERNSADAWSRRKSEAEDHAEMVRQKRASVRRDPTEKRLAKYMDHIGDKLPGGKDTAEKLKPLTPVMAFVLKVLWIWAKYTSKAFEIFWIVWEQLPKTFIKVLYGVTLCFFGGTFVVGIAAIEAFFAAGWRRAYYSALVVYDESRSVGYALELDDYADVNNDGIADVDMLSSSDLVQRKTVLAFETVQRPEELQSAVANVWAAYLAVLATLKFEFAVTTAFAVAIAQSLQFFFLKIFGPPLSYLLPKKTEHWWGAPRPRAQPHPAHQGLSRARSSPPRVSLTRARSRPLLRPCPPPSPPAGCLW